MKPKAEDDTRVHREGSVTERTAGALARPGQPYFDSDRELREAAERAIADSRLKPGEEQALQ